MAKKSVINNIMQNFSNPQGFIGKFILRMMNKGHSPLASWARNQIVWGPDWNVLDIGCGGGANIKALLEACPQGKVHGIDISQESIACSKSVNEKYLGSRCFLEIGNVEQLPYSDNSFDAVTAMETIYFWKPLRQSFQEVHRVLSPSGYFLICCEASDPKDDTWTKHIEGMTIYSSDDLVERLKDIGFINVNVFKNGSDKICIVSQKVPVHK